MIKALRYDALLLNHIISTFHFASFMRGERDPHFNNKLPYDTVIDKIWEVKRLKEICSQLSTVRIIFPVWHFSIYCLN